MIGVLTALTAQKNPAKGLEGNVLGWHRGVGTTRAGGWPPGKGALVVLLAGAASVWPSQRQRKPLLGIGEPEGDRIREKQGEVSGTGKLETVRAPSCWMFRATCPVVSCMGRHSCSE